MGADGKIYITISDKREGSTSQGNQAAAQTEDATSEKESIVSKFIEHKVFNFIQSEAKTMVNYSLANIGNFTGDYDTQREVSATLNAISSLWNIGTATFTGAKVGGVGGAIASLIVSTGIQAVSYGLQEKSNGFANYKENYNIEKLRQISGLDGTTNGGRI